MVDKVQHRTRLVRAVNETEKLIPCDENILGDAIFYTTFGDERDSVRMNFIGVDSQGGLTIEGITLSDTNTTFDLDYLENKSNLRLFRVKPDQYPINAGGDSFLILLHEKENLIDVIDHFRGLDEVPKEIIRCDYKDKSIITLRFDVSNRHLPSPVPLELAIILNTYDWENILEQIDQIGINCPVNDVTRFLQHPLLRRLFEI